MSDFKEIPMDQLSVHDKILLGMIADSLTHKKMIVELAARLFIISPTFSILQELEKECLDLYKEAKERATI